MPTCISVILIKAILCVELSKTSFKKRVVLTPSLFQAFIHDSYTQLYPTHTLYCIYPTAHSALYKSLQASERVSNPLIHLIPCHYFYYVSGVEAVGSQLCEVTL